MERFWRNSWCGMLAVLMVGAAFWLQPVMAEAGISTLHPGAGNRPPKTPEWNVEQSRDSGNTGAEAGKNTSKGVKKLDKKNVPVTMLSVMLGEGLYSASVSGAGDFELVDGNTLQKITDWEETSYAVGCITVFCGEVRLIDNIKYKEPAAL